MQVTVVVCTRNGEAFLGEQLASILAQSVLPQEIIVSDDDSQDSTRAIIGAFAETARSAGIEFHQLVNVPPLGVTRNFEAACQRANGDVIFLADQDDRWDRDKIGKMMAEFSHEPVLLVASNARIFDAEGHVSGETLFDRLRITEAERLQMVAGQLSSLLLYRTILTGATFAFKRQLLQFALPFDARMVHDEWLAQIAWMTGEVKVMREPLMDYRLHSANTIGLDAPAIPDALNTPNGRLALHLRRMLEKLQPILARFSGMHTNAVIPERHALRQKQLALASERMGYASNFVARLKQVAQAWRTGLYDVDASPNRTALLDIFRHSSSGNV